MTDTKLEPELPQATFFITGEIGKPMIPAYTAEQVRAAIEADRNKRAPLGSLTDEQIVAAAHNADGIGRVSLTLINNDRAEVPTFVAKQFARALLSSVAPRVPEGFVLMPKYPTGEIISAMASSTANDGEGEFLPLADLIGFSGDNKTRVVLQAAYSAAIAAPQPTQE